MEITTELSFFDIMDALFDCKDKTYVENCQTYSKLTDAQKTKHFFIINRRLAIGFPSTAFALSKINVNPVYAMDVWYSFTSKYAKRLNGFPKWLLLSTKNVNVSSESKLPKSLLGAKQYYMKTNQIGDDDFELAMRFDQPEMIKELKNIANFLK